MTEDILKLKDQFVGLQKKYIDVEKANKNLNQRILELYSLYQISFMLSVTLDLDEIYRTIKKIFKQTLNVDQFSIMLLDETGKRLEISSSYGFTKYENTNNFKSTAYIFGEALRKDDLIYIPDITKENNLKIYPNGTRRKSGSFLTIPLKPSNNIAIGVLNLFRKQNDSFTKEEIELFTKISEQVANVIDKILLFKHTKELSITDELTGVYNRRYFNQRLEREVIRAKRYKRPLTLLMIDIDYFKNYNDVNGHVLGDEVLRKVADLLEENIRKADILARYGGEEFVLLLPEIDKEHAFNVSEKLRLTVQNAIFPKENKQPFKKVTISIGMATLLEDTYSADELIDFADKALYKAKNMGRNQVVGYFPGLNGDSIYPINKLAITANMN